MSISSKTLLLFLGGLTTLLMGCAMPGGSRGAGGKVPRVAAGSSNRAVPSQAAAGQPIAAGPTARVGDEHELASTPPANAAVTPVAYHASPAGFAQHFSGQSACGCNACNAPAAGSCLSGCRTCPPQGPYGYAMPTGPWNAYGIDPQEFICDGGDHDPGATLRRDDSIAGLQPEDTVVHYTTQAGNIEFEASNRVCVYAPRFLSVRKITEAVAGGRAIGAAQMDKPLGPVRVEQPLPGLVMTDTVELGHADVARRIDAMRERNRGVPVESIQQLEMASDVLAALVGLTIDEILALQDEQRALFDRYLLCAVTWELDESVEVVIQDLKPPTLIRDEHVEGFTIYEFPDGRLRICKLADRGDALPGEIVNFAIRVENVGDAPVEDIVLTDNLTTRLEYVEGSQTCSGGAIFDSFENEGQSLRLQWKLTDKLRVGESVTIRFQCRVR
jgi:uncharacterized repeat protein (TIGR01451 family)